MEGSGGGSFTPSYKEAVANESKKPPYKGKGKTEEGRRNREEEAKGSKSEENEGTRDKEKTNKKQGRKDKNQKEPYKPKAEITPRVVLNNPELQAYKEHMQPYAII